VVLLEPAWSNALGAVRGSALVQALAPWLVITDAEFGPNCSNRVGGVAQRFRKHIVKRLLDISLEIAADTIDQVCRSLLVPFRLSRHRNLARLSYRVLTQVNRMNGEQLFHQLYEVATVVRFEDHGHLRKFILAGNVEI